MQRGRRRTAWMNVGLAIVLLTAGGSLALEAVGGVRTLFPPSVEAGYLLYPRLGLCAPNRARITETAASTVRQPSPFRPARTADAVLPPGLGQSLSSQLLGRGLTASQGASSTRRHAE